MHNVKLFFWKRKGSISWRPVVLLFAVALMLRGCRCHQVYAQSFGALKTLKMKCYFGHLAPGEAVPCRQRNEAEAYKRNTGTRFFPCTGTALRKGEDKRKYGFFMFLEMKGQYFMAACSPAVRCSPRASVLPLPSGLRTKLWRLENPKNEMLFWPFSPG